jgi:hypothetical protein
MDGRGRLAFLLLVLAQAAHSAEEYVARLYEVFAPARFVSALFSRDLALGFLVANAAIVAFGLWCWLVPLRKGWPSARTFAWCWTFVELVNGTGHPLFALSRGSYFPGVITAPLLLLTACWLALVLLQAGARGPSRS